MCIRAFVSAIVLFGFLGCGDDDAGGDSSTGTGDGGSDSAAADTGVDARSDASLGDAGCGPSPCGACAPPAVNVDRCEGGGWVCRCEVSDGGVDAGCDQPACADSMPFRCAQVTQGQAPDPDNPPPTVCGCMPSTCPGGESLIVSGAAGTWCDGSSKGTASCSSQLPP